MLQRALCSTLVGREAQLFALEDALFAARCGESRFVALGGEAGLGKTRLASELARRANALDFEVLWSACSEAELALPYLPLVEALGNYISLGARTDWRRSLAERAASSPSCSLSSATKPLPPVGDPSTCAKDQAVLAP